MYAFPFTAPPGTVFVKGKGDIPTLYPSPSGGSQAVTHQATHFSSQPLFFYATLLYRQSCHHPGEVLGLPSSHSDGLTGCEIPSLAHVNLQPGPSVGGLYFQDVLGKWHRPLQHVSQRGTLPRWQCQHTSTLQGSSIEPRVHSEINSTTSPPKFKR